MNEMDSVLLESPCGTVSGIAIDEHSDAGRGPSLERDPGRGLRVLAIVHCLAPFYGAPRGAVGFSVIILRTFTDQAITVIALIADSVPNDPNEQCKP